MIKLVAIVVTLFLVIQAKADVALWPRPVPGRTVIQVYGDIQPIDLAFFQSYTANVDPDATLVIVTGHGGPASAGIGIGMLVHQKKLIAGVMGMCASSCPLIWIGGETGRKFIYQDRPGVVTRLCFRQPYNLVLTDPGGRALVNRKVPSDALDASVGKYISELGYNPDMIEWAKTDPNHQRCLTPEVANKLNIDFWYNTEDAQHHTLPGDHGLLPTTSGY
jgi:hypothetical protein